MEHIRFASLGSGSGGNGTVVQGGGTTVLVDCGFSVKQTTVRLKALGVSVERIDALLVTHEHGDHVGGVIPLAHRFDIPVYASHGTLRVLTERDLDQRLAHAFVAAEPVTLGELTVLPVPVPHDAREPTQYVITHGELAIGILTDLGHVTPFVIESYRKCNAILMESNHDAEMLRTGDYPARLKRRIAGKLGHLSNAQAAGFLEDVIHDGLTHVVIGHISEQNNAKELLQLTFRELEKRVPNFAYATQTHGIGWTQPMISA